MNSDDLPLKGLVVLEFAQFLSGPLCGLRLADLGARVIKIEKPGSGDLGRNLYLSDTEIGGVNSLFHAINRNKESFSANLKDPEDKAQLFHLIEQADVVLQNFRPGVFDRLGFTHDAIRAINPRIVNASVTGYGTDGPWVGLPGQDLLAQARSGLMWLNGADGTPPQPVGLAVADMLAGHNLVQGVLAALVRRGTTGVGGQVSTSLLESLVDFQFEVLTTHLNDGKRLPTRPSEFGAHTYLSAPYGVYPTADGFLAIAMTPVGELMQLLGMAEADQYGEANRAFAERNDILARIGTHLSTKPTDHWLGILQARDIWCAEVLNWQQLLASDGFKAIDMLQNLTLQGGGTIQTTRTPIMLDGGPLNSSSPAPQLGEHTQRIRDEFELGRRPITDESGRARASSL